MLHLLTGLLGLAAVPSATIIPPLRVIEAQLPPSPQNFSIARLNIIPTLNLSIIPQIDTRFTYEKRWAEQILDKKSAYMNTLLALADLSTRGWTTILRWEASYSFFSYRDVIVHIHSSHTPSILQYRHAIWGLWLAIRESSANGFRACSLILYWTPQIGGTRQELGYLSLLHGTRFSIDNTNSTEESLEPATATNVVTPDSVPTNLTTTLKSPTTLTNGKTIVDNLKIEINLLEKPLAIDAIFHTLYAAEVYLASWPQSKRVDSPGVIRDPAFHTVLRWDSSYLTVQPTFEYRYVIAALARLPAYMYEQDQIREARFIVFVDEIEVGRGWLYANG